MFCPVFNCKNILFKDVTEHFEMAHIDMNLDGLRQTNLCYGEVFKRCVPLNDPSFPSSWQGLSKCTSTTGAEFYFMIRKDCDQFIHFWFYFLGSVDEAKNYSATCSVVNNIGEKFTYTGRVHTLEEKDDDIIAKGSLLTMRADVANRCMNEKKKLQVEILVRDLMEEVKDEDMESSVSNDE